MAREPGTRRQPRGFPIGRSGKDGRQGGASFQFIAETVSELRKVTWPTRQETTRLTILVIIIAATIGAVLGLIDLGFSRLIGAILGT
jgi:preprotein translocase subunit SecE